MKKNLRKLLKACEYFDYGMDKISLLELSLNRDENFTLDKVKLELLEALDDEGFDWVKLAIDTKFVYTSTEFPPKKIDVDELIIFTDSFRWRSIVQPDAILTIDQKDELKEQFREIGVQYYDHIHDLLKDEEFNWLPFEVKHAFKSNFSEMVYTNEDIIYHLKNLVWLYLFPNALDKDRLQEIETSSLELLRKNTLNEGWLDTSAMIRNLIKIYPEIDLFELSKINWPKTISHKIHYRNPYTLGFKRHKVE